MKKFKGSEQELTVAELDTFQQELEITLPQKYIEHILVVNGGKPLEDTFNGKRVHYFHSIKYGDYPLHEIIEDIKDVLPDNLFPFAEDEGGNAFCISLSEENNGEIYIWYHDMDDEDKVEFLADSFEDFMKGLTERE